MDSITPITILSSLFPLLQASSDFLLQVAMLLTTLRVGHVSKCLYFWVYLYIILINGYQLPWSWDTIPVWAEFSSYGSLLTDYQAEFMATHYDVLAMNICYGGIPSENSFVTTAAQLRKYASHNETKILFYAYLK